MAARAKNATHQFQQAGGFSFARELAFSFNILPLTAKSGSNCDAVKAVHNILQQLTKNTKKPLPSNWNLHRNGLWLHTHQTVRTLI